jgi:hypothetical protein
MLRITIQQFRALLAGRVDTNGAVRGYRQLGRRPDLAAGMRAGDWVPWDGDASRTTS